MIRLYVLASALLLAQTAYGYESCTVDNSYLENMLPEIGPRPFRSKAFPETCVETAQLTLAPVGYYGFCPTPQGQPARDQVRPCISEKYVNTIHSALVDVADCLDYDPYLAFASFNLESALHLNAVGAGSDVGVGQLTKSAIDEVTLNALPRALRLAKSSAKLSCRRIIEGMTSHPSENSQRCGFMSLPENPLRNVIYSVLLLQQNRRVINNLWTRYSINLSENVDVERLKTQLAMLAYNSGPGGIMTALKAYVEQAHASAVPLLDEHFNFEVDVDGGFRKYLADFFPSTDPAVRKRVSRYIGYITVSVRRVDLLAGGTRSCLHPWFFFAPKPLKTLSFQPDALVAQNLIEKNMTVLAKDYKTKREFEFAFLPKDSRPEDLPAKLYEIYLSLP